MNDSFDDNEAQRATDLVKKRTRNAWQLVVVSGLQSREMDLVPPCEVTIGRDQGNAIRLDHASVSRKHAKLVLQEGATIEDLGSANGTKVEGRTLTAQQSMYVRPGSLIEIGEVMVLLREPDNNAVKPRGVSGPMERALELATAAAHTNGAVFLYGPEGSGKRHLAERIHAQSPRKGAPFLPLRISLATEVHELFGTSEAAPGILERAQAGVCLLQDVDALPRALQSRLDEALTNGTITRADGTQTPLRARVLAASRRSLAEIRLALDPALLERLLGLVIEVVGLGERSGEIRHLAEEFLRDAPVRGLSLNEPALGALLLHKWQGNVRELKEVMLRASARAVAPKVGAEDLAPIGTAPAHSDDERARILLALEKSAGNQTKAALLLGISRRTLINRLDELGLPRPRKA